MKRKITFDITVGSHWPSEWGEPKQWWGGTLETPVGGEFETKTIEFETDNKNPFDDACNALDREMQGKTYHVWYWTWTKEE